MPAVTDHCISAIIEPRKEMPDAIMAELRHLSEQVRTCQKMLQATAARERISTDEDTGDTVFVLDDVAPRHAAAEAALVACDPSLARALEFLLNCDAASRPATRLRLVPPARD